MTAVTPVTPVPVTMPEPLPPWPQRLLEAVPTLLALALYGAAQGRSTLAATGGSTGLAGLGLLFAMVALSARRRRLA